MRIALMTVTAVSLFIGSVHLAIADDMTPNWDAIVAIYMEFSSNAYPTESEGTSLLARLPMQGSCNGQGTSVPDLMIDSEYFKYLADKAQTGNKYAAEAMFRLRELVCSDAEHSEQMDIAIGKLIRPQPELFLTLVRKYQIVSLGGLLGNLGDEFVDNPAKSIKELKLRYSALASAKDASHDLREECLAKLKQDIDRDTEAM